MKSILALTVLTLSILNVAFANEERSALIFKKAEKIVTYEETMKNQRGSLGLVKELVQDELCYTGRDYEIIDMLVRGINHFGGEICDKYIIVTGTTIIAGPCFMSETPDEIYQLPIDKCNK